MYYITNSKVFEDYNVFFVEQDVPGMPAQQMQQQPAPPPQPQQAEPQSPDGAEDMDDGGDDDGGDAASDAEGVKNAIQSGKQALNKLNNEDNLKRLQLYIVYQSIQELKYALVKSQYFFKDIHQFNEVVYYIDIILRFFEIFEIEQLNTMFDEIIKKIKAIPKQKMGKNE